MSGKVLESTQAEASKTFADGLGPGLAYLGLRSAAWTAERLPLRAGDVHARLAGGVAFRIRRGKRAIVRRNLARILPGGADLNEMVREAFRSYSRYWLETFRLGRYSREDLLSMVDCLGWVLVESAIARGGGLLVVTGHFGFYDLGLAWVGVHGLPVTTVAEVLRPRAAFEWFAAKRERHGWRILPAKPGSAALRGLTMALRRGEAVALVA
ncbi:MAG: lysophospholipid acyltransferase family protein, partial [Candidatus Methylomirabilales bacterium]